MKYLFLLILIVIIRCDLPVHCVKHQIIGKWKFLLEKPQIKGMGPLTCGHEVPDSVSSSYKAGQTYFQTQKIINLELLKNNKVKSNNQLKGDWTMVYDEGFEVLHDSVKYFAFSRYVPTTGDYESICSETLVGWYNNQKTQQRGCYKAVKVGHKLKTKNKANNMHVVQPKLLEYDDDLDFKPLSLDEIDQIVNDINNKNDKKWTAKPYWKGMGVDQINRLAGRAKYQQVYSNQLEEINASTDHDLYRNFGVQDVSDLPASFSWEQFLPPVREQKNCGSCYAISTMNMLSSRLAIKGQNINLSPQYSIDCNYYNQGCDGGYPFLVEKFLSETFAVEEKDYPYKAFTQHCPKKLKRNSNYRVSVKSYKFIGGSYGKSSERAIMEEIYYNGPVVMNFEPEFDFMFYGGGVYHSTQAADWILHHKERPEWEKVDHSVLCYGWGEEDGEKYWLLQNSWGEQWGENGTFRMRRGTDESAIESMAEAAIPELNKIKKQKKNKQKEF